MTADLIPPEVRRDRYGRYLLPDPDGGKELPWTRVTTFAKSVSDTFALGKWQTRMAVKGICMRPDLYALASATPLDEKQKYDKLCDDAKEAAAASSGANLGTALHSFTERIDRGEQLTVPPPWDADVAAYKQALADAGVVVLPAYMERIVVHPELRLAGTFDNIHQILATSQLKIGDKKTGQDLSYAWTEIAIQEAIYAQCPLMWNPVTNQYDPMPDVDKDHAIVVHLPAGKARCTLYDLDIAAGWEGVQICQDVREWRKRKGLAKPLTASAGPDLLSRIKAAQTEDVLVKLWEANASFGVWTELHTAAAKARKRELVSTKETA